MEQPEACPTHQAVLASAAAITICICTKSCSGTSSPRKACGSSVRNSAAPCSASSNSFGKARSRSIWFDEAAMMGAMRLARSTGASPPKWRDWVISCAALMRLPPVYGAFATHLNDARGRPFANQSSDQIAPRLIFVNF